MKMVADLGKVKKYDGENGQAVLTRNFGNLDKTDKWSVSVVVNGQYKKLANRADFQKAYALAEQAIN